MVTLSSTIVADGHLHLVVVRCVPICSADAPETKRMVDFMLMQFFLICSPSCRTSFRSSPQRAFAGAD